MAFGLWTKLYKDVRDNCHLCVEKDCKQLSHADLETYPV